MEGQELAAQHIALREQAGLTQEQEAKMAGVSPTTISGIESGKITRPHLKTLLKIARTLGVDVGELRESGKAEAPSSQDKLFNNGLEDERRARWDADVQEARQLRKTARTQMQHALKAWRKSKDRGEPYATRRKHLDEMGALLQEAYGAYRALGGAYIQAALSTPGGSEASVPSYLGEESQAANDFYVELFGLVRSAGLGIRTGDAAAAPKQAAAEHVQSETRPLRVEEPEAA